MAYSYIDTGAMYRAVTLYFLQNHVSVSNQKEVEKKFPGIFKNLELTYPTIFKIDVNSGKIDYYDNDRTAEKIKEWVNS